MLDGSDVCEGRLVWGAGERAEKVFKVLIAGGTAYKEDAGLLDLGLQDVELLFCAADGSIFTKCSRQAGTDELKFPPNGVVQRHSGLV